MALGLDDKSHSKRFVYQIADAPSHHPVLHSMLSFYTVFETLCYAAFPRSEGECGYLQKQGRSDKRYRASFKQQHVHVVHCANRLLRISTLLLVTSF